MDRTDFDIGLMFWCGRGRWRCTDVGTRTVIAIRIDKATLVTSEGGIERTRTLTGPEAESIGWFNGPPYGVVETVFDEYELAACSLEPDDDALDYSSVGGLRASPHGP